MEPAVARREERGILRDTLRRLIDGAGSVVTLEGEPGAGKTALLDAVALDAQERRIRVARTGVTLAEQPIAWAGLATLLESIGDTASAQADRRSIEVLRSATSGAHASVTPTDVAFALGELFERLCDSGPLVVLVDDVHWLDRATAGALALAVRKAPRLPMLFVLTRRPDTRDGPLLDAERLVPQSARRHLVLAGLSPGETAVVLQHATGSVFDRATLMRVHGVTGGNPLYVVEVARQLGGGVALDDALRLGPLSAAIAERLSTVSAETLDVLMTAALCPLASLDLLARAHHGTDLDSVIAEAEREHIAAVVDGAGLGTVATLQFAHPLLRAAAAERLGSVERARRHRALAVLVADAQQHAFHLGAGALRPDDDVASTLCALGVDLVRRAAPAEAAAAFRRAAELSTSSSDRDRRLFDAGSALVRAGDYVGALAVLEPLASDGDPEIGARALLELIVPTAHAVGIVEATAAAERAIALIPDPAVRTTVLCRLVRLRQLDDAGAGLVMAHRALAEAASTCDRALIETSEAMVQNARAFAGEPVDLEAVSRSADGWTGPPSTDSPPAALAEILQWCDRPSAVERIERGLAAAAGSFAEERNLDGLWSNLLLRTGRWDEAEVILERIVDDDALAAMANLPFQLADLGWLRSQRGRDASDIEATMRSLLPFLPPVAAVHVRARLGGIALAAGDVERASDDLLAARATAAAMGLRSVRVVPHRLETVEALVASGRLQAAAGESDTLTADAERSGVASALAEASAARALLLGAQPRARGASSSFADAVRQYDDLDLPFDRARVLLAAGSAARREGQRNLATAHLESAIEQFERLGATPWASHARIESERIGGRQVDGRVLTATEARIAELVSRGQTNEEIAASLSISRRTVESNLTRAYRKLGIRSRSQLVKLMLQT